MISFSLPSRQPSTISARGRASLVNEQVGPFLPETGDGAALVEAGGGHVDHAGGDVGAEDSIVEPVGAASHLFEEDAGGIGLFPGGGGGGPDPHRAVLGLLQEARHEDVVEIGPDPGRAVEIGFVRGDPVGEFLAFGGVLRQAGDIGAVIGQPEVAQAGAQAGDQQRAARIADVDAGLGVDDGAQFREIAIAHGFRAFHGAALPLGVTWP